MSAHGKLSLVGSPDALTLSEYEGKPLLLVASTEAELSAIKRLPMREDVVVVLAAEHAALLARVAAMEGALKEARIAIRQAATGTVKADPDLIFALLAQIDAALTQGAPHA